MAEKQYVISAKDLEKLRGVILNLTTRVKHQKEAADRASAPDTYPTSALDAKSSQEMLNAACKFALRDLEEIQKNAKETTN